MKLHKIYNGVIPTLCNTPCKIAIFTDGKNIKVYQKEFFRSGEKNPNCLNWYRNINLERIQNINQLESKMLLLGFK